MPLALPMIWFRPRTSLGWKIGLTIVILLFTWLLWLAMQRSLAMLSELSELF